MKKDEEAKHLVPGGETKGWSASDLTEDDFVDDEWIRQNVKVVEPDGLEQGDT